MHRNGYRFDFLGARYGEKHDTVLGAWKKRCLVFDRIRDLFLRPDKLQFDMPYVRCLKKRAYVVRLSTVFVSLQCASGFFDHASVYKFFD